MFWKFNSTSSSEIDALLNKEDVALREVMDNEEIINQCKVQNKTLIDFLLKPEVMEELVILTTREPSIDIEERIRFKYPNIACELLTSDVPAINERLASDELLLDRLYSFLECEPPLNPLLASYFSRIMGALIAKKTEQNWLSYQFTCLQVLDFLKAKDTFISLLLKHLGTSAIMDLTLKLMTQVDNTEMQQNSLNWLDSQRIIQSLVSLLNPKTDKERLCNVVQLLCDFIREARDSQRNSTERVDPDPLLNTIESSETVSLLLVNMFEGEKCGLAIGGGITVLLTLLDVNHSSIPKQNSQASYNSNDEGVDLEQKENVIKSTTEAICGHLKKFHDILLNPPEKPSIKTTLGVLDVPLGKTRLNVIRLFAAIISCNNAKLLQEFISLGTFPVLLDLFFKYPWNNFLHTQVENCLVAALKTHTSEETDENSNALSKHLLISCNLVDVILKAWKDNDEQQKEGKAIRQGYMGHLITITNKIVDLCSNTPLGKYFSDHLPEVAKTFEEFKESTLKETNAVQNSLLGGAYPNAATEEHDEFNDMSSYPQDQIYSTYQMQHLTSNCIDEYSGFNDDSFNDGDYTLQSIDHRTDMNFSLTEGDMGQQHELFKQMCAQNISTLDDADDQIFEDRDHTFQTVIEKEDQSETTYSSDSDEDSQSPLVMQMDVDPWMSPKTSDVTTGQDPWAGVSKTITNNSVGDWADFNSATFEVNFDAAFSKVGNAFDVKNAVENDLKVENIEIESKTDSKPETVLPEENKGKDNGSIENVAQTSNQGQSQKNEVGDTCPENEGSQEDKEPPSEPSSTIIVTEGDSCLVKPQDPATSDKKDV